MMGLPAQLGAPDDVTMPTVDLQTIVTFFLIFLGAYLLGRLVSLVLTEVSERAVTHRIGIRMAIPMLKFTIYLVAVYLVLGAVLDLTTAQLLAFSGLLGAALGFGLQDLFAGVVGGLVILLERPYRVGDKIEIEDRYGEVTDVGLRATRLVTPDDDMVSVPNYVFFTESVANANDGNPEMMVVMEFYVAADAPHERAMTIVTEAVITSRYIYVTDDCSYTVSMRDRPYYGLIRVRAYVNDHRHERALISDVTERVLTTFAEEGIEKPRGFDGLPGEPEEPR